jgi:hypothetical protein
VSSTTGLPSAGASRACATLVATLLEFEEAERIKRSAYHDHVVDVMKISSSSHY